MRLLLYALFWKNKVNKNAKIFVAGHKGLVGSAIIKQLQLKGYSNLVLRDRTELDLLDQIAVNEFFRQESPEYVIDCAAKVGGIKANMSHPAEFLYENLQIQNSLIWAAKESKTEKFIFLGSSCVYPRDCPQPMKEEHFGTGRPDSSNEAYAYAKIAGTKFCEYINNQYGLKFISCMPTNIYGENDNFSIDTSHVIPSLIRRMHEAKVDNLPEVVIWGTGISRREFLHVDDLASAVVWIAENYKNKQFLNIGTGEDISIRQLAELVKELTNYRGDLVFDADKPDGMPKKLLDVTRIHDAGWKHSIELSEGLERTYDWYLDNVASKGRTAS